MTTAGEGQGRPLRLAVDIGGTFVDAVELDRRTGAVRFQKAPTTPAAPWQGVVRAIGLLGSPLAEAEAFIHGTTLGLNAVLERRGATVGIITNEGCRDIFLIGRGDVPWDHMYDFQYDRPPGLVRRRHTVGVGGRLNYRGEVLEPLDERGVREAARHLVETQGVTAVAVCFLHAFRNPDHEQRAAAIIRAAYPHVTVSVSTDITREHREYERTSTTVLDAYIRPVFERYVDRLGEALAGDGFGGRFLIMRSGGGAMTAAAARSSPTHTMLSGPAGGIVGAVHLARLLDRSEVLSFDVGGTSLDTCIVEAGGAVTAHQTALEHHPLLIPAYDIRTIGAGGGSIASLDEGLLQVGPRSAGAEPGPICYGRGGAEPTVTDAAVCLGYIDPARFLGGTMALDAAAARAGVRRALAEPLGRTAEGAAAGVFAVLLARTVGAVRQITVERGRDPRGFSLLAFGGAGPLLGPLLAREMGIGEVVVPRAPAAFSAWGMLASDIVEDAARTDLRLLDEVSPDDLAALFAALEADVLASLTAQEVAAPNMLLERQLELRYLGQEHALGVVVGQGFTAQGVRRAFEEQHEARYGHAMPNQVQLLTVRVRGIGRSEAPTVPWTPAGDGDASRARVSPRRAYCFAQETMLDFAVYARDRLLAGDRLAGPAIVDEGTATTVIHSDQVVAVDQYGHLLVTG